MLPPTAESDAARDRTFAELAEWVKLNDTTTRTTHRYGPNSEQVADLRTPTHPGPHPVVILIHGGNWRAAHSRTKMEAVAVDLVGRGWATWNIEYRRLGNGGGHVVTANDVDDAIRALDQASDCVDRHRVVLLGHSTGGQLALCAGLSHDVAAVVSIAGYCDLAAAAELGLGGGATQAYCGGSPDEVPAHYRAADPLNHLPLGRKTLLFHGTADDRVPFEQSISYAGAAKDAGDECELLLLPDADHFSVIDPRTEHWSLISARLAELLD
jgi:dipeptidyl aminopeptidase/acylaminoacyl peptidase